MAEALDFVLSYFIVGSMLLTGCWSITQRSMQSYLAVFLYMHVQVLMLFVIIFWFQ